MSESSYFSSFVQRHNRCFGKRSITHRTNVIQAQAIRLFTFFPSYQSSEGFRISFFRINRVCSPLITNSCWFVLHTKSNRFFFVFSSLINYRTLSSTERFSVCFSFKKVLTEFWTNRFKHISETSQEWIIFT